MGPITEHYHLVKVHSWVYRQRENQYYRVEIFYSFYYFAFRRILGLFFIRETH